MGVWGDEPVSFSGYPASVVIRIYMETAGRQIRQIPCRPAFEEFKQFSGKKTGQKTG